MIGKEIWKPIPGYDGYYEVSNLGRIKSLARLAVTGVARYTTKEKILKQSQGRYCNFAVCVNGKAKTLRTHVVVALAFHGNPPGKVGRGRYDWQVNHIDGNKTNNSSENLEWVQAWENNLHATNNGLKPIGENHKNSKLTKMQVMAVRSLIDSGWTTANVGIVFGVCQMTVNNIAHKKSWSHVP